MRKFTLLLVLLLMFDFYMPYKAINAYSNVLQVSSEYTEVHLSVVYIDNSHSGNVPKMPKIPISCPVVSVSANELLLYGRFDRSVIEIMDESGQVVHTIGLNGGEEKVQLPLLKPGVYSLFIYENYSYWGEFTIL